MNKQEVFNTVKAHLLAQGCKSTGKPDNVNDLSSNCRYRGDNGRKCAIGCLIPDELYQVGMEGLGVYGLVAKFPQEVAAIFGVTPDVRFLHDLQLIHDCCEPFKWAGQLQAFASENGLEA